MGRLVLYKIYEVKKKVMCYKILKMLKTILYFPVLLINEIMNPILYNRKKCMLLQKMRTSNEI